MDKLAGFIAQPIVKWIIGGLAVIAVAGTAAYVTSSLRQGGRDAERADQNARTLKTQEKINDADARGPRTPDAVDKRLRDGSF